MNNRKFLWMGLAFLLAGALLMVLLVTGSFADNSRPYEIYIVGDHVCVDFGEWGECFCPCDAECDTPLGIGIGGGPPLEDNPGDAPSKPTATAVPVEEDNPKDAPVATATSRPTPGQYPTNTPGPKSTDKPEPTATDEPKPTATVRPTSVPPTATARSQPMATVAPIVPPWDGGCICHKKGSAPGKVTWVTLCFKSNQRAAYDAHIGHGDSEGSCP